MKMLRLISFILLFTLIFSIVGCTPKLTIEDIKTITLNDEVNDGILIIAWETNLPANSQIFIVEEDGGYYPSSEEPELGTLHLFVMEVDTQIKFILIQSVAESGSVAVKKLAMKDIIGDGLDSNGIIY